MPKIALKCTMQEEIDSSSIVRAQDDKMSWNIVYSEEESCFSCLINRQGYLLSLSPDKDFSEDYDKWDQCSVNMAADLFLPSDLIDKIVEARKKDDLILDLEIKQEVRIIPKTTEWPKKMPLCYQYVEASISVCPNYPNFVWVDFKFKTQNPADAKEFSEVTLWVDLSDLFLMDIK